MRNEITTKIDKIVSYRHRYKKKTKCISTPENKFHLQHKKIKIIDNIK